MTLGVGMARRVASVFAVRNNNNNTVGVIRNHGHMSSAKRTSDHFDAEQQPQRAKRIHPFFTAKPHAEQPSTSTGGPFRWLEPLGASRSCLYGISHDPTPSAKVAAFDLDGTLIKSDYGAGKKPSGIWEWWRACVPAKLKEVADSGCVCDTTY